MTANRSSSGRALKIAGARWNRASDPAKPSGTERGLRDVSECLALTLGAAQPGGSTILELDWTADRDPFSTPQMLLSGRRHFKHGEN
jgi:hypothetical protein